MPPPPCHGRQDAGMQRDRAVAVPAFADIRRQHIADDRSVDGLPPRRDVQPGIRAPGCVPHARRCPSSRRESAISIRPRRAVRPRRRSSTSARRSVPRRHVIVESPDDAGQTGHTGSGGVELGTVQVDEVGVRRGDRIKVGITGEERRAVDGMTSVDRPVVGCALLEDRVDRRPGGPPLAAARPARRIVRRAASRLRCRARAAGRVR